MATSVKLDWTYYLITGIGCTSIALWYLTKDAEPVEEDFEPKTIWDKPENPISGYLREAAARYDDLPYVKDVYFAVSPPALEGQPPPLPLSQRFKNFLIWMFPMTYALSLIKELDTELDDDDSWRGIVRWQAKCRSLVDVDEPPVIDDPTQEELDYYRTVLNPPKEPLFPWAFAISKEEQEKRDRAEEMKLEGGMSLHPWYPNNRLYLDAHGLAWREKLVGHLYNPILPPRSPLPYGKALTLVLDAKVVYTKSGRRPGLDAFLARTFEKYEIIIYGETIYTEDGRVDPGVIIDGHSMYTTHHLTPVGTKWPFTYKNVSALNRPYASTLVLDWNPDNTITNPDNAVIMTPWDGKNYNDTALMDLSDFLDYVAQNYVSGTPVPLLIPEHFQDFEKDIIQIWREKKKTLPKVETIYSISEVEQGMD